MDPVAELKVDGEVEEPLSFTFAELDGFPDSERIADVSQFDAKRKGVALLLEAILNRVRPRDGADYLTLHAERDDFAASIPLAAVRSEGLLVYKHEGHALTVDQGGPFRFLIRNPAACHTEELDDCANVKFLDRIELSSGRGRDTRPETDEEHEHLHEQQGS